MYECVGARVQEECACVCAYLGGASTELFVN